MSTADHLSVVVDGRVAVVTLDDPPANALSLGMTDALAAALDTIEESGVPVAIFRSAVPGFFVAGADLKLLAHADDAAFGDYMTRLRGMIERIPLMQAVTIAALDGHTLGGGLELAAACTFRVGGPDAKLGVPEVKLGLLPGAGGTQRLPRMTGRGTALDLLLTGRSAAAKEALHVGLIDRLDPVSGEAGARALAEQLVAMPASAVTAIVRCVNAAGDLPLTRGLEVEEREIRALFAGADAREGLTAFLQKRRPDFG
jgi:enoyl-CoA hydratase